MQTSRGRPQSPKKRKKNDDNSSPGDDNEEQPPAKAPNKRTGRPPGTTGTRNMPHRQLSASPIVPPKQANVKLMNQKYEVTGRHRLPPETAINTISFVRNYKYHISLKSGKSMLPQTSTRDESEEIISEVDTSAMFEGRCHTPEEPRTPEPVPQSDEPPSSKLQYMIVTRNRPVRFTQELEQLGSRIQSLTKQVQQSVAGGMGMATANLDAVRAENGRLKGENALLKSEINTMRLQMVNMKTSTMFMGELKKLSTEYAMLKTKHNDLLNIVKDDPVYKNII